MTSVFALNANYEVNHDSDCEEEFVEQLAKALRCAVVQSTKRAKFFVVRDAAIGLPVLSSISVKCRAHGESNLAFNLSLDDDSDGKKEEVESPLDDTVVGEPNVRIYGESVLQRIPFGPSAASQWSPLAVSVEELLAYGVANAKKVIGCAKLTVCSGSVVLEVRNAESAAHAADIAEWALRTPMLAEVVEAAVMKTTLQPLLCVTFFAHSLLTSDEPFECRDEWFLANPIWIDSMSDASGEVLSGMIHRATKTLFSERADDLFVLFTSPTLPFVKELAPSDVFWNVLVNSHAEKFRKLEKRAVKDCPETVRLQLVQRNATCAHVNFLQPLSDSMLIVGARRQDDVRVAVQVCRGDRFVRHDWHRW
jgi:hypothetical protein